MEKYKPKTMRGTILILLFTLTFSLSGKSQVKYGSNNGNYLTIRGTKLYYEEYGKGMPLLLLHGGLGNSADFKNSIKSIFEKYVNETKTVDYNLKICQIPVFDNVKLMCLIS